MEWVSDWLAPYADAPATDPAGPAEGTIQVERGGVVGEQSVRRPVRLSPLEDPPTYGDEHIGFRVVSPS